MISMCSNLSLTFGCSVITSAANSSVSESDSGTQKVQPNILFILADDLGWADVGYHGSEIQTPNIDRLAEEGISFGQHYVMPTCTPTRVGLMTGQYPSRYGVTSPAYGKIFDEDTVTLAAALRDSGYHTSISGKWHMGSPPECVPLRHGFDASYGYFHGQIDPYTHRYKNGERSWHRNDQLMEEAGHATDLITAEAVRVIESDFGQPCFLYVAYSVPHYPLNEPPTWTSLYDARFEELSRRWYAASVTHMDQGIGRIVDALERADQRENTLLVFVSDNGGQRSWHDVGQYDGQYADKPHNVLGDNRPWRGWKGQVYEGGIRVPAFASWPGTLQQGKVTAPVHIVDWMPTLCNLVGYHPKRELAWDGQGMWPLLQGEPTQTESRPLYWKTPNSSALRYDDWKLVCRHGGSAMELYHLETDPCEEQDLAQQHPKQVSELKEVLENLRQDDRG